MDPSRTAHLNDETPRQIHDRLQVYRAHNAKFMEYFPDGTCRELERNDPLNVALLAKIPFPNIEPQHVQQMMNTLRYFLFDLQNQRREIVPHHGPEQTLSNMVFYRQYQEGYGLILPVQTYNYAKFAVSPQLRNQLAQTAHEDEVQMQQKFVTSENGYYLDVSQRSTESSLILRGRSEDLNCRSDCRGWGNISILADPPATKPSADFTGVWYP
ncbi:hypothetical protein C8R44DRAFT_791678, partial [Mycena epipterygia]